MAEFTPVQVEPGSPLQGGPATPGGRGRPAGTLRWGVALVVVALVVGAASVGTVLMTSGATTSAVEGWIPAGTIAYLEARADLPGDQRENVGNIIATFPGFKDQASLDSKIDQALDEVLQKTGISWTSDLKPWVAGEVGVAVTGDLLDIAAADRNDPATAKAPDRGFVVLASVKDVAAATDWVAKEVGGTASTSAYADGTITTVDRGGMTLAWATRGTVLFLGPEVTVKAALDTNGASPVAASSGFMAAKAAAPGAYLGFGYLDTASLLHSLMSLAGGAAGVPASCLDSAVAAAPGWSAGFAHASGGALVMDHVAPAVTAGAATGPVATDTSSAIAAHLPATTLIAIEGRQAGPALVALWSEIEAGIACDPAGKAALDKVDTALAAIGGIGSLAGWAGDAALAVTRDGTTWGGGLAAIATDPAAATRTLDQLRAVLALAGGGAGISVAQQPYAAGTITVVTLPALPGTGAAGVATPPLAVTAQGSLFAIGTVDFVKAVLDTPASAGLASQAGYQHAIDVAGGAGVVDAYVNITGVREGLESLIPATDQARYTTDVQPFLAPLDAFAAVEKAPAGTRTSQFVVIFK